MGVPTGKSISVLFTCRKDTMTFCSGAGKIFHMKNQYFGDINDYFKYGLLRILAERIPGKISVCWMLTEDDSSTDGRRLDYLSKPDQWRKYDPQLFDKLRESVIINSSRDVVEAGAAICRENVSFFNDILSDNMPDREGYFQKLLNSLDDSALVFFDPDIGIAPASMMKGKKKSSKYLFWSELKEIIDSGKSALIYQHYHRKKRDDFIEEMSLLIEKRVKAHEVFVFRTPQVAFFLVPQPEHLNAAREMVLKTEERWSDKIKIDRQSAS